MTATVAAAPIGTRPRSIDWAKWRVTLCYLWRHRRFPELNRPRRFTEWVQWRKLHDRNAALATRTDKLRSKDIVAAEIGPDVVVPTLWTGLRLPEWPAWPFPFIVKANHGCNQFVVVRNEADYRRAIKVSARWLRRGYGEWLDEWHYRAAERLILVEPFLGGDGAPLPLDYKVYVFGGRAEVIQLHADRGVRHRWTQFDRNWRALSRDPIPAPAPAMLREMLIAAEALAAGEAFLRVDFYCVDDRLWFGEFCLFPGSGLDPFQPDSLDRSLGELWTAAIPDRA